MHHQTNETKRNASVLLVRMLAYLADLMDGGAKVLLVVTLSQLGVDEVRPCLKCQSHLLSEISTMPIQISETDFYLQVLLHPGCVASPVISHYCQRKLAALQNGCFQFPMSNL